MTLLLLNQTFYPDVASTAQHLSDLASELVKQGHEVTVVTGRRAYGGGKAESRKQKVESGKQKAEMLKLGKLKTESRMLKAEMLKTEMRKLGKQKAEIGDGGWRTEDGGQRAAVSAFSFQLSDFPSSETWRGVRIYRVFSTGFGKKARWRRAVDFGSFILSCCVRLIMLPRHDVVVALTTPPLISFIGAWRARLWRSRFCYWVMDFNPDEAIAAGWLQADSTAARILERMSRFSLRRADSIIALDRFMRDRIAAKGIQREKIAVIPPWSHDDEVRFDAAGRKQFRKAHGFEGKFVVMYSGNHTPVHPLDTLLQAAEKLRDNPDIAFCFAGGGSEFGKAESVKQKAETENWKLKIVCLPYQPLDRLGASLSAADLHVVVMGDAFVGLVHPCKIYNVLAVGAPVLYIGPAPSHVTEILESLGKGHSWASCAHGDVNHAADQIQRLMESARNGSRQAPAEAAAGFSKSVLLTKLMEEIVEN